MTILEAGLHRVQPAPDRLTVKYRNVGPITYNLRDRTFRRIGGTSENWFGNTPRPMPNDLRLESIHGFAEDWPFGFAEFEPDLEEAERILGTAGTADDPLAPPRKVPYPLPPFPLSYSDQLLRKRLTPHGIHVSTTPQARTSQPYRGRPACVCIGQCLTCPIEARTGPTASTLLEALNSGRATLTSEAMVTHLEADASGRVTRAVWHDPAGASHAVAADVFVVAGHVPDSVRLLLHSTSSEWPHGLGNRHDVVGRYFMDNPRTAARAAMPERTWPNRIFFQTGAINFWRDRPDRARHGAFLIEIQNFIPDATPSEIVLGGQAYGAALKQRIRERWGFDVLLNAETEVLPLAENRITLAPEHRDAFGVPTPLFDIRFSAFDLDAIATAREALQQIFTLVGARKVRPLEMPKGTFDSCYHPDGGLRMGTDPETSVTDPGGRVHGLKSLFVSGTALFPTIGTANPTLTMVALAIRVARSIRERGGRGEL